MLTQAERTPVKFLLILSALVLLLGLARLVQVVPPVAIPRLEDLPWTRHAQEQHAGQQWNTGTISQRIQGRQCQPILAFVCPKKIIVMCPVGPDMADLWTGLVIGTDPERGGPVLVTGYAAPARYWMASVAHCLPTSYR